MIGRGNNMIVKIGYRDFDLPLDGLVRFRTGKDTLHVLNSSQANKVHFFSGNGEFTNIEIADLRGGAKEILPPCETCGRPFNVKE